MIFPTDVVPCNVKENVGYHPELSEYCEPELPPMHHTTFG